MEVVLGDLKTDHLYVAHSGKYRIPLTDFITASPLPELLLSLSLA